MDVLNDQYHCTKLPTVRQAINEEPMEFANRCKGLAQRVMCKVIDPVAQRIHRQNADRMCLVSFVNGLSRVVGCQFRYAHTTSLQETEFSARNRYGRETRKKHRNFYTNLDEPVGQTTRSLGKRSRARNGSVRAGDSRTNIQQLNSSHGTRSGTQTSGTKFHNNSARRCYESEGIWHFVRECPKRLKRLGISPNSPGRKNPSELSKRPSSSSEKHQDATTGSHKGNTKSGKRIRVDSGDSSLHLGVSENAVGKPTIAVLLEHCAPSITLETEGQWRRPIVDTGSNVSILQPRTSR